MKKGKELVNEWLSKYQQWYWKDPDHARVLQRAKYKRYPKKIYATARAWQKKNKAHWNMLIKFATAIHKAKKYKDFEKERQLRAAREEYKAAHNRGEVIVAVIS